MVCSIWYAKFHVQCHNSFTQRLDKVIVFVILALWRLSEEDREFRAGICYRVSHYLQRNNIKQIHLDHLGACTCFCQLDTNWGHSGRLKNPLRKCLLKIVGKVCKAFYWLMTDGGGINPHLRAGG